MIFGSVPGLDEPQLFTTMQRIPSIYFGPSELGGRGVFSTEEIQADSLIEICPVIACPKEDLPVIHKTFLHDYYFLWGENDDECAIALGFGSLYNHSRQSNARYWCDPDNAIIEIWSIRDIEVGEEITVNYNGDPEVQDPVWFEEGGSSEPPAGSDQL